METANKSTTDRKQEKVSPKQAVSKTVKRIDKQAKELFSFNLLPPRSRAEMRADALRAARNFYAAMLPVGLAIFAILLLILNELILGTNLKNWNNSVTNLNTELSDQNNYLGSLKVRNGELRTKTMFIAEPVTKNVDFNDVFTVTNNSFRGNNSGSQATSYGREESGEFVVNGISRNASGPSDILKKFSEQPKVKEALLKQVRYDNASREYLFTVTFVLQAIEEEEF